MCGRSFFFFKQKTAYEMRISDWSSDVCLPISHLSQSIALSNLPASFRRRSKPPRRTFALPKRDGASRGSGPIQASWSKLKMRSEEHTSELQSLMRISYAVFCLKQKILILSPLFNSTLLF